MATTSLRQNDDEQPRKARAHATEPDPVEEDETPPRRRPRPAVTVDEEDAPPPRRRAVVEEDEDPAPPRRRAVVEEDAPPPRRRAAVEEIDEEDAPPPRRKSREPEPEEDEDPAPPPRRRSRPDPEEDDEPPRAATALALREDMSLDRRRIQQLEGEFTSRDMATPYLNLGQKSGNLCDDHPEWIGTWVYDKSCGLGDEIRVIVLHIKKQYEEKLEFGSQDIPMIFDSAKAARDSGCETREVAGIDMLIEVHPKQKELKKFVRLTDKDGYHYIPARYVVRSSAYGRMIGTLYKDFAGWLEGDFASGYYVLTTEKKVKASNTYHVPKIKSDGPVDEDLRAEIEERLAV